MKRLICFLIMAFSVCTCGLYKHTTNNWETIGAKGNLLEIYNHVVDSSEFINICMVDTLSFNLEDWSKMGYYTYDNKLIEQWLYIKESDINKMYILTKQTDSTYNLNIRIVIK